MTEETPRFEGEVEGTYVEVKAEGPIGDKRLRITVGVPGSKFVVYLSGEEADHFESQVSYETDIALGAAGDDEPCFSCGAEGDARWHTKEDFEASVKGWHDVREWCGSPQEFPVALCSDCICPK